MRNPIRPKSPPPPPTPPPPPPNPSTSLTQSTKRKHPSKTVRAVCSILRSFPIFTTATCKPPSSDLGRPSHKITCTLYGHKKGHVTLSLQDASGYHPTLILSLPILTHTLHKELRSGMVRITLESEKRPKPMSGWCSLLEERVWSVFWNGKKNGFGTKRDANEADLNVMELLKVVSMGIGVVPDVDGGEVAYIRAKFEHVVGSKDSETLYMLTPEGNNANELAIFFVRL